MKRLWILALIALAGCGSDPVVRTSAAPSTNAVALSPPTGCQPGAYTVANEYTVSANPKPKPPPAAIAHYLLVMRVYAPMQAALDAAASEFDAAMAANANASEEWVVATDELGNRVVADPTKDATTPSHYVLEASDGRQVMQFGLHEAAPGHWYVEAAGSC